MCCLLLTDHRDEGNFQDGTPDEMAHLGRGRHPSACPRPPSSGVRPNCQADLGDTNPCKGVVASAEIHDLGKVIAASQAA